MRSGNDQENIRLNLSDIESKANNVLANLRMKPDKGDKQVYQNLENLMIKLDQVINATITNTIYDEQNGSAQLSDKKLLEELKNISLLVDKSRLIEQSSGVAPLKNILDANIITLHEKIDKKNENSKAQKEAYQEARALEEAKEKAIKQEKEAKEQKQIETQKIAQQQYDKTIDKNAGEKVMNASLDKYQQWLSSGGKQKFMEANENSESRSFESSSSLLTSYFQRENAKDSLSKGTEPSQIEGIKKASLVRAKSTVLDKPVKEHTDDKVQEDKIEVVKTKTLKSGS